MKIGGVKVYEHEEGEFTYVLPDEIPAKFREEFDEWMCGQTVPVVEGKGAVYAWDWERWYKLETKGIPTYWD